MFLIPPAGFLATTVNDQNPGWIVIFENLFVSYPVM